jgi:hypothetical protein
MNAWWSLDDISKLLQFLLLSGLKKLEVKLKKIVFPVLFVFLNSSVWWFTLNNETSIPLSQALLFLDYTGLWIDSGQNTTRTALNDNRVYVRQMNIFPLNICFVLEAWQRIFVRFLRLHLWVSENCSSANRWHEHTLKFVITIGQLQPFHIYIPLGITFLWSICTYQLH